MQVEMKTEIVLRCAYCGEVSMPVEPVEIEPKRMVIHKYPCSGCTERIMHVAHSVVHSLADGYRDLSYNEINQALIRAIGEKNT